MARPAPLVSSRLPLASAILVLAGVTACGGGGGSTGPSGGGGTPASTPVPTPTPAGTSVGPAGGTVTGLGGAATLIVPANALAAPVALTLDAATGTPLDPSAVTGSAVRVGPAATFSTAATLVIRYDPNLRPSGSDESELRVHVLGPDGWSLLPGGSVDVGARTASAPVSGAGSYAVRWPDPTGSCRSAESGQFDFWVGTWSFAATGSAPGTNDITKEAGGCLIQEHFRDTLGTLGRSVSFVSRSDGLWHQTYIDSVGGRLVLVGRFEDGQMRLYSSPTERFGWLPQGPDRIRYFGERTSDGGATWRVAFDSTYTRR